MFEQDCEKVGIGNDLQCFAFNVEQDYLNVVYTMCQSLDLQMLYKCIYPLFRFSVVVVVYIVFCNCLSLKSHLNSRCLTGSTRTERSSWPTMLTSVVTTVFSKYFSRLHHIPCQWCYCWCLLHLCITRNCQQASRGARTIHSGLQCKSSSHSKYLWYRIRTVRTIQYKTEIIPLEYI